MFVMSSGRNRANASSRPPARAPFLGTYLGTRFPWTTIHASAIYRSTVTRGRSRGAPARSDHDRPNLLGVGGPNACRRRLASCEVGSTERLTVLVARPPLQQVPCCRRGDRRARRKAISHVRSRAVPEIELRRSGHTRGSHQELPCLDVRAPTPGMPHFRRSAYLVLVRRRSTVALGGRLR
jgi:hypothetical protein